MKKVISIIAVICLCFGLVGCGSENKKPDGMDDDDFVISQKILETTNKYISGDLDATEASDKLDSLSMRLSNPGDNFETSMI